MTNRHDNKQERTNEDPPDKTDPFVESSAKGRKGGSRKRIRRQGRHQSTRQQDSQAQSGSAASPASGASGTPPASGASAAHAASTTTTPAASAVQISAPDLSGFDVFCDDYRYSNEDFSWDFYDDRPSAAGQPGQTPFAANDATRPLQRASSSDKTAAMSTAAMQTAAMPKATPSAATAPYAAVPYTAASSTAQMPSVPSRGRQGRQVSPTEPFPTVTPAATIKAAPANEEDEGSSHRFGHALRWIFRILMICILAFCLAMAWQLVTLTDEESTSLSLVIAMLDAYGVQALESLDAPVFTESPIEWTLFAILYTAAKLAEYSLSVEQQLHVVVFALIGIVVTANVLAWFSGTRHRHTILMTFASLLLCACASIVSQYCAVYVLGFEFDLVALALETVSYTCTVLIVVTVWRIVSAIYRSTFN